MRLALLLLSAFLAFGQNPNTAVFPSSIATDNDLLVASNRASANLSAAVTSGATTIPVDSTAAFIVPTVITFVDNGEMAKCLTKTASSFTSCTRGFDSGAGGIAATAHASGLQVVGNATAYYFNQLAVEMEAVETAVAAAISNPMTTLGDTMYGGASGAVTRLPGDTSNTRKFLREQASGGVAQAPAWDTIQAADVPTLNQSTTGNAATATALASNPTETGCQATSVPTTVTAIDASANLTCTAIGKAAADGATFGVSAFTAADFDAALGVISIDYANGQSASGSTKGFLTAADWTTFNSKQAAGDYVLGATNLTSAGAIPYVSASGTVTQNSTKLAWDSTNLGLCVGCTSTGSATTFLRVTSAGDTFAFIDAPTGNFAAGMLIDSGGGGGAGDHAYFGMTQDGTTRWIAAGVWNGVSDFQFIDPRRGFASDLTIHNTTGDIQFPSYGAGTLVTDSSGNVTAGTVGTFNQTIQEEGSDLTQRAKLNFIGPMTCADNSGNGRTDCTMPNRQITMGVGAGDISSTGVKACSVIRAGGTIQGAYLIANALPTGANLVIDVMKIAFSSYTGSSSPTSITASATPQILTSDTNPRYSDTTLTGWTTSVSAGDVVCVKVSTAPTGGATWASLTLEVK